MQTRQRVLLLNGWEKISDTVRARFGRPFSANRVHTRDRRPACDFVYGVTRTGDMCTKKETLAENSGHSETWAASNIGCG
jgi:hypothetical protein